MQSIDRMKIKTDSLPDEFILKHPVRDDQDEIILDAGIPITVSIKQQLLGQGSEWVVLHQADALEIMGLANEPMPELEEAPVQPPSKALPRKESPPRPLPPLSRINAKVDALDNTVSLSVENNGPPLQGTITFKGTVSYDPQRSQELAEQFASAKTFAR